MIDWTSLVDGRDFVRKVRGPVIRFSTCGLYNDGQDAYIYSTENEEETDIQSVVRGP